MNIDDVKDFNFYAFAVGTAIFVFLSAFAVNEGLDWLILFSSIGPLYIGYKSKNRKQGFFIGCLSGIFLGLASLYGALGPITNTTMNRTEFIIIMFIICILIGGFIGFIGAYFNKNRQEAIRMAESEKKGSKNTQKTKRPIEPALNSLHKKIKK